MVYTADAVTPYMYDNKITHPGPDELKTIDILTSVSERIMNAYPHYRSIEYLGYDTYLRTKKYLADGDADSHIAERKKALGI